MSRPHVLVPALAALMVVLGLAACSSYTQSGDKRTPGEIADDVLFQTKVKTRLMSDPDVHGLKIDVDVHKGVVYLYGRVGSEALRQQALALAGGVKGVVRVEDRLAIVPE